MNTYQHNSSERDQLAWSYHRALEAGDFDTVTSVLAMAESDPQLEIMLLDLNDRRLTTLQGGVDDSLKNDHFDTPLIGDKKMQIQLRTQQNNHQWLTMLTAAMLTLLAGAVFFIGGQVPNSDVDWNAGAPPIIDQGDATDPTTEVLTQEEENLLIAEDFVERVLMQPASIAVTEEIFTEAVTYHLPHGQQLTEVSNRDIGTLPALIIAFARNRGGDVTVAVERMAAVDDTVMMQLIFDYNFDEAFDYQGTHFGTEMQLESVWIVRIENGQIAELWTYEDSPIFRAGFRYQSIQQYDTALQVCGEVDLVDLSTCPDQ